MDVKSDHSLVDTWHRMLAQGESGPTQVKPNHKGQEGTR